MRTLTRNEKLLLVLLALVVIGGANFFGYKWISARQHALDLDLLTLRADHDESQVDLQPDKVNLWAKRRAWISQHEPDIASDDTAQAQVLEAVRTGAIQNKLDVTEQNLRGGVEHNAAGRRANVEIKVKGSLESLVNFMAGLQKPGTFYAVTLCSLKADQDQKSYICRLEVCRYFKGT